MVDAKKGTYVDGHERSDVVEYGTQFLRKMVALGFLNRDNAPTLEAKLALPEDLDTPRAEVLAKTIVLCHDESTFQANDYIIVVLAWEQYNSVPVHNIARTANTSKV